MGKTSSAYGKLQLLWRVSIKARVSKETMKYHSAFVVFLVILWMGVRIKPVMLLTTQDLLVHCHEVWRALQKKDDEGEERRWC